VSVHPASRITDNVSCHGTPTRNVARSRCGEQLHSSDAAIITYSASRMAITAPGA